MARANQAIQQHEVAAYGKFCAEHNIIYDGSPDDVANSNFVVEYFTKTWVNDISAQTLALAFPQLQPHLKFNTPARQEAQRLMREYPDASALANWFDTQSLLSKKGDDGF